MARFVKGWRWCHGKGGIAEWEEDQDFGCHWCPPSMSDTLHRRLMLEPHRADPTIPKGFPQDQILVALLRGSKAGMTPREISEATGRAQSTVANNLAVLLRPVGNLNTPWVQRGYAKIGGRATRIYTLTQRGREIARGRARRMKADAVR
jgi:DNA-binding MarR family transcriptional regulator